MRYLMYSLPEKTESPGFRIPIMVRTLLFTVALLNTLPLRIFIIDAVPEGYDRRNVIVQSPADTLVSTVPVSKSEFVTSCRHSDHVSSRYPLV